MRAMGMVQPLEIHYMDHVAPICDIMKIPLQFIHQPDFQLAQEYYPWTDTRLVTKQEFSWAFLVANYDVIFISGLINRRRFKSHTAPWEKTFKHPLRYVHCPHGFSDKILYMSQSALEDITLVYGQNHLDLCTVAQVAHMLNSYVVTGNYRLYYYRKHREFFDGLVKQKFMKDLDASKPTILYAPSWKDYDESTTFYDHGVELLNHLPDDYNLLIKPHPRLKIDHPSLFFKVMIEAERKKNVVMVDMFPPVYPLLSAADIYLGDVSSIGYDFLAFNKPMFFLNKHQRDPLKDRRLYLNRCGVTIAPVDFKNTFKIIEQNIKEDKKNFAAIRKQVYEYTFGERRAISRIRKDIIAACSTPRAWKDGIVDSSSFTPITNN